MAVFPARRLALCAALVLAVVPSPSAPAAPAAESNPLSQWMPGCGIDGHPVTLTYFFCNDGYFGGHFVGAPNNHFFAGAGAYFNVAIYDSSPQGFRLWGPLGDAYSDFEEIGPTQVRGSGAPEDPFEHRAGFGAGDPRQLYIRPYTQYVNGRNTFETWWVVENVSDRPLNFRATVFAGVSIHAQCAYGDLRTSPRALGSFSPDEGVPHEPNDCSFPELGRGFGGYALERAGSEWSAYQQGEEVDVKSRIADASGPGLANTYEPRPVPEVLAIQWDDHGKGRAPLAPGETATFRLGWRFTSALLATPYDGATIRGTFRLTVSTRHAAGGAKAGKVIAYKISRRHVTGGGVKRGTVRTNERGIAWLRWRQGIAYYDWVHVGFETNGDGRFQEDEDLDRGLIVVYWEKHPDSHRTDLSFERSSEGFRGRVRAIHQKDYDFGRDCRKYRTIAIRRRQEGRDPTLASAATNERGFWKLSVDAPRGDYYGIALASSRVQGNGDGYWCRAARAS